MTYQKFSEWIDERIDYYTKLEEEEWLDEQAINNYLGKIEAFKAVKERFLTLTPPHQQL